MAVRERNAEKATGYLLWGSFARATARLVAGPNALILESPHPSPLAEGFVGNDHFATVNRFLVDGARTPVDWALPPPATGVTTTHSCREL